MRTIKKKYLIILGLFLVIGLFSVFCFWFLSPQMRQARQLKKGLESFDKAIKAEEQKYAADTYGGTTPEETYQLFLEALKKQDIELASKYFILDKQETYKQFFTDIKNNDKWDEMIEDLLKLDNQKGEMKENNTYVIRVYNDEHYLIAQATLRVPFSFIGTEKKPLTNIWKIIEF
jgi:hypothetical protein